MAKQSKLNIWNKYLYTGEHQSISLNYLLGLISLTLLVIGYWKFFELNLYINLVFLPIAVIVLINKLITLVFGIIYPDFNLSRHKKFCKEFNQKIKPPSVDVFLPIAGESIEVLRETWTGVKSLNYSNYKVYVLDDAGDENIKLMAVEFDFYYLTRPNKGVNKKAGNLQFGYQNSSGEHILILDADFVPHSDFLTETLPYLQDQKIAILQTPQYFQMSQEINNRSIVEYGAGAMVEDFYRIIMPCRDKLGGAMCVGTSALYRRGALDKINGFPQVEHSEDIKTGLNLLAANYTIKYLPIILSRGRCPDNLESYIKQQIRWCHGALEALFSMDIYRAQMSLSGKLAYLGSGIFYLSEAFSIILSLQIFFLVFLYPSSITLIGASFFLPFVFYNYFLENHKKLFADNLSIVIIGVIQNFTFLYAIFSFFLQKPSQWLPAGLKQKSKTVSKETKIVIYMILSYSFFYFGLIFSKLIISPKFFVNIDNLGIISWLIVSSAILLVSCIYILPFVISQKEYQVKNEKLKSWFSKKPQPKTSLF